MPTGSKTKRVVWKHWLAAHLGAQQLTQTPGCMNLPETEDGEGSTATDTLNILLH